MITKKTWLVGSIALLGLGGAFDSNATLRPDGRWTDVDESLMSAPSAATRFDALEEHEKIIYNWEDNPSLAHMKWIKKAGATELGTLGMSEFTQDTDSFLLKISTKSPASLKEKGVHLIADMFFHENVFTAYQFLIVEYAAMRCAGYDKQDVFYRVLSEAIASKKKDPSSPFEEDSIFKFDSIGRIIDKLFDEKEKLDQYCQAIAQVHELFD
ncbi:MAG: hypothetical protein LBL30_03055 [Holosporales bacterium]|jgi:hypothetical protein|nr:hypothetical protein [Holosporales bacterium]